MCASSTSPAASGPREMPTVARQCARTATRPSRSITSSLDLISALALVGAEATRQTLDGLHAAGFPELRVPHGYVFQRLIVAPHTVTELAAGLGVTQQAISKLAAELLAAGYVERSTDARDSRRRPLTLSARGRTAVTASRRIRRRLERDIVHAAGAEAVATAMSVLTGAQDVLGIRLAVSQRRVALPPEA